MGILLSELDSCPDVEALSCLVKLKLTLARNGACIYTAHSSFDMRTASRYQSLGWVSLCCIQILILLAIQIEVDLDSNFTL
jgi:hypothetical protein